MSRRNASSESTLVTFLATFWKSWPLLPTGTLTTSKARRVRGARHLRGVTLAEAREPERLVAERITDRRAQDIETFGLIERREIAPAVAIEDFDLLCGGPPAPRRPQDIRTQPDRLVGMDIGDEFQRQVMAAGLRQRAGLQQQALIAQLGGQLRRA